ncbi:uncharacterized protein V6R79_017661 [Siganus canaliculatus]
MAPDQDSAGFCWSLQGPALQGRSSGLQGAHVPFAIKRHISYNKQRRSLSSSLQVNYRLKVQDCCHYTTKENTVAESTGPGVLVFLLLHLDQGSFLETSPVHQTKTLFVFISDRFDRTEKSCCHVSGTSSSSSRSRSRRRSERLRSSFLSRFLDNNFARGETMSFAFV